MAPPAYTEEADLYCAAFSWPVDEEVDWLLGRAEALSGRRPRTVLEPLCGNARYGPAFADRGVAYTGFDRSPAMLARAPADERLRLVHADALGMDFPDATFDLAWCPINSLRHLPTPADLGRHLARVARALVPGGLYVVQSSLVDHHGPWPVPPEQQAHWTVHRPDGTTVHARWWYEGVDRPRRTMVEGYRFERRRGDEVLETVEGRYSMLALSARDWRDLASPAGLELVEAWSHTAPPGPLDPAALVDDGEDNPYLVLRPAR